MKRPLTLEFCVTIGKGSYLFLSFLLFFFSSLTRLNCSVRRRVETVERVMSRGDGRLTMCMSKKKLVRWEGG